MADHHFWLSEAQCARLRPLLPAKVRGVPRVDDWRGISGIIHVIRNGLRWRDAPACYGPPKTLYNRFVRWSKAGVFNRLFAALADESDAPTTVMIDTTHLKAHRTAASLLKMLLSTKNVTALNACSAASRTGGALPPAMIAVPIRSSAPSVLP